MFGRFASAILKTTRGVATVAGGDVEVGIEIGKRYAKTLAQEEREKKRREHGTGYATGSSGGVDHELQKAFEKHTETLLRSSTAEGGKGLSKDW